ncbi:M23 family metallopeptidase [Streptomyces roseicoloratus]|uniref:M23 family metallopeptidase n=1 Tax=Streptomyces roseicoloratus TaxID=2508722 RepID=UPI001009ECBD|nr:M23 family metallopeptidase [Streptomyces roseicoloratus]
MNDQHPHAGYVTDATQTTGSFAVDPLFGTYDAGYDAGQSQQNGYADYSAGYGGHTGYAEQSGYATADHGGQAQWDTGSYGSYTATGQWDATAWTEAQQAGPYEVAAQFTSYDSTGTGQWTTPAGYETGAYDATAWNQVAPEPVVPHQYSPDQTAQYSTAEFSTAEFSGGDFSAPEFATTEYPSSSYDADGGYAQDTAYDGGAYDTAYDEPERAADTFHDAETMVALELDTTELDADRATAPGAELPARPVRRSGGSRGRRRTPAKRSALLTVAVPSACVMGVAGIAAASVSGLTDGAADTKDDTTSLAAADPASVKQVAANSKLDTQLAALSADARDFGDRASRTQERIDLKLRQEAEKKKREEEAARREALRPKFMLPVKLHQLSARYGQSGVNWMSVHTGIDFPVQYGTPVMAATDGTVRTQWNSAYGNMAIVTAPDGTETWYCHLSSTKIRSGKVKAGEVIAYSGNSGNSTGPHLHFEVRPGGGSAIDPLAWLRSHGLDPTS